MPKRKVKIYLNELIDAYEMSSADMHHYLDLETARILFFAEDTRYLSDKIYAQISDEDDLTDQELAKLVEESDLQDWEKRIALDAVMVADGENERFTPIPQVESYEAYRDMEAFISTVSQPQLQELLLVAIDRCGAFRHF